MSEPTISFIVSVHNCVELTRKMIQTLFDTVNLENHEVILIDDASTDETPDFLVSISHRCRVLRNAENLGFSKSNNRAAQAATGDLLLFLNNDLELVSGWLEPMLNLNKPHLKVGAVGNIQRNYATGLVDHAGIFFDLNGMPTHAWKNRKRLPPHKWSERTAITGACFLIRRSLFNSLNGFSEDYRNGMEDVDLCARIKEQGYRLLVSHESVIRHHISRSPGRHDHNDQNSNLFKERWSQTMRSYGSKEWPSQYFHRYARYWWRMDPKLALKALWMLLRFRSA